MYSKNNTVKKLRDNSRLNLVKKSYLYELPEVAAWYDIPYYAIHYYDIFLNAYGRLLTVSEIKEGKIMPKNEFDELVARTKNKVKKQLNFKELTKYHVSPNASFHSFFKVSL